MSLDKEEITKCRGSSNVASWYCRYGHIRDVFRHIIFFYLLKNKYFLLDFIEQWIPLGPKCLKYHTWPIIFLYKYISWYHLSHGCISRLPDLSVAYSEQSVWICHSVWATFRWLGLFLPSNLKNLLIWFEIIGAIILEFAFLIAFIKLNEK